MNPLIVARRLSTIIQPLILFQTQGLQQDVQVAQFERVCRFTLIALNIKISFYSESKFCSANGSLVLF